MNNISYSLQYTIYLVLGYFWHCGSCKLLCRIINIWQSRRDWHNIYGKGNETMQYEEELKGLGPHVTKNTEWKQ